MGRLLCWAGLLAVLFQLTAVVAITFDPCAPLEPIKKGSGGGFVVGLAFWPGGTAADWGSTSDGVHPCNGGQQVNLTSLGIHVAAYNARIDRLSVLKTTFSEQLALTAAAKPETPLVVSVVAFRAGIRSEPRYVVSGQPSITGGTGFVSTLSLMSRFEMGVLKYLQFYNLSCNDCGGWRGARCINGTSCTLPVSNCTCTDMQAAASVPNTSPSPSPSPGNLTAPANSSEASLNGSTAASGVSPSPSPSSPAVSPAPTGGARRRLQQASTTAAAACNYTQFSYCAASINFAYDGLDSNGMGFSTASQVRKLNSYSLVSLFAQGKALFFNFKDKYDNTMTDYWGKFNAAQQDVVAAYSGNAQAGRTTGSSGGR